jgi:hypothetical protein
MGLQNLNGREIGAVFGFEVLGAGETGRMRWTKESAPDTLAKRIKHTNDAALVSDTTPPLASLAFALLKAGQSRKE